MLDDELQTALFDFQRYLLDQIPPLTASDAVETLMSRPPELLIKQIHAWTLDQSRQQEASQCDFLFHALKKVYLFSVLMAAASSTTVSMLELAARIWVKASSGARLGDWEPQIAADVYRVRRLVARWMEEGALQPA